MKIVIETIKEFNNSFEKHINNMNEFKTINEQNIRMNVNQRQQQRRWEGDVTSMEF